MAHAKASGELSKAYKAFHEHLDNSFPSVVFLIFKAKPNV